jgi:hypothetical protein
LIGEREEIKMRTLLVCLLGLAMMAASATTAGAVDPVRNRSKYENKLPPGAPGICNSQKDAVFIFVAYKDGDIRSYKCDPNPDHEYRERPENMTIKVKEGSLELGKWRASTESDPCYQYQIDGETRVVCW